MKKTSNRTVVLFRIASLVTLFSVCMTIPVRATDDDEESQQEENRKSWNNRIVGAMKQLDPNLKKLISEAQAARTGQDKEVFELKLRALKEAGLPRDWIDAIRIGKSLEDGVEDLRTGIEEIQGAAVVELLKFIDRSLSTPSRPESRSADVRPQPDTSREEPQPSVEPEPTQKTLTLADVRANPTLYGYVYQGTVGDSRALFILKMEKDETVSGCYIYPDIENDVPHQLQGVTMKDGTISMNAFSNETRYADVKLGCSAVGDTIKWSGDLKTTRGVKLPVSITRPK